MPQNIGSIPAERLGESTSIDVAIVETDVDLYYDIVDTIADLVRDRSARSVSTCLIVPVGPVGQYERLARRANRERLSFSDVTVVAMDEYLGEDGAWIAYDHPLSFRRHLDEHFYARLDDELTVPPDRRIIPDPHDLDGVQRAIDAAGGVDLCVAGVGITGHLAFNEPPSEPMTVEAFADLPTRVLQIATETRVINSVTATGGDIEAIPRRAVTVGMLEILAARAVRVYMNRPWQPAIARRWLHGPVTPTVPASLLQRHQDVRLVITRDAASDPGGRLR